MILIVTSHHNVKMCATVERGVFVGTNNGQNLLNLWVRHTHAHPLKSVGSIVQPCCSLFDTLIPHYSDTHTHIHIHDIVSLGTALVMMEPTVSLKDSNTVLNFRH